MTTKIDVQTKLELLKVAAQLTTAEAIANSKRTTGDDVSGVNFAALEPKFGVTSLFEKHATYLVENFDKLGSSN